MKSIFKGGDKSVKKLVQRKARDIERPLADKLRRSALSSEKQLLIGQSGVPESADAISYEPVQRLLAISSSDGRVKVIGQDGVEKTLVSNSPAEPGRATQQVHFLPSRGVVVRISQGGTLELWSLEACSGPGPCPPLEVLEPQHDGLLCLSAMCNEPFLLLGCVTGAVRIAILHDAAGSQVDEARPVKGIKLLPYHVTADMMGARGYVAALSAKSSGPVHRLLVQHSQSDVVVWDLRAGIVAGTVRTLQPDAPSSLSEAGGVTCTCWVGGHGCVEEFVTGHTNGDVLAWSLPLLDPTGMPQLLRKLRLVGSEPAASIRHLEFVGNRSGQLLLFGGQQMDAPDSLTLLPVRGLGQTSDADPSLAETASPEGALKVPWFGNVRGYALIPAKGSFSSNDEPGAIIVLLESGQLQVHDLKGSQQMAQPPCSLPLQSGARVVASSLYSLPEFCLSGMSPAAATMATIRQVAAEVPSTPPAAGLGRPWTCVLAGGEPPQAPLPLRGSPTREGMTIMGWGTVLCSGHENGMVKVWDMFAEQPRLLLTAPSSPISRALDPPTLRAVTTLQLFWPHGILLVGHERGEARVYQLNQAGGVASVTTLEGVGDGTVQDLDQPPGLQLKIRLLVHSANITCMSYCASTRLTAVADEMGAVSLIHTSRAQLLWYVFTRNQPVRALEIAMVPMVPTRQGPTSPTAARGEPAWAIVVACQNSELGMLDDRGQLIGNSWMKPKNLSQVLYMALLNPDGSPVWMAADKLKSSYGQALTSEASGSHAGGSSYAGSSGHAGSPSGTPSAAGAHARQVGASRCSGGAESDCSAPQDDVDSASKSGADEDEEDDDDEFLAKAAEAAAGHASLTGNKKSTAHLNDDKHGRTGSGLLGQGSTPTAASPSKTSPKTGSWSAFDSLMSADSLYVPFEQPEAHYTLVVTTEYLRIYSTSQILQSDRSTVQKKRFDAPALFASTFHAHGAPAVAVVVGPLDDASLQVYSLPNLYLFLDVHLASIIPWAWAWPDATDKSLPKLISTNQAGQLAFVGRQAELVLCALVANTPYPAQASALFDWELAAAAHAAQLAVQQAALKQKKQAAEARAATAASAQAWVPITGSALATPPPEAQLPHGNRQGLKLRSLFKMVNVGVNQALNETSKGLQHLVQAKEPAHSDAFDAVAEQYRTYPTLAVQFSQPAEDDGDYHDGDSINELPTTYASTCYLQEAPSFGCCKSSSSSREGPPSPRASAARFSVNTNTNMRDSHWGSTLITPKGGSSLPRTGSSPSEANDAANRAELFGNTAPSVPGRVRTADEIRAAYGRPPANKGHATSAAATAASSSIFEQTRQALGERGDALARLQDKTAAMESDAASFAAMAKQLAEREKNRKWWQL